MTLASSDNRRSTYSVAAIAALLVVASIMARPVRANADEPSRSGWWNAANPGAAGVDPPPPPDVPDDGLYVAGGAPGATPSAFSAVLIPLPDGQSAKSLTLKPANTPSPNLALQACIIPSGDFPGGANQPSASAPTYDCVNTKPVAGQVDAASGSVSFAVSSFSPSPAATTATLAVAILPVGPTDRVAFAKPDAGTVTLESAPSSSSSADSSSSDPASTSTGSSPSSTGSSASSNSGTPSYGSATTGSGGFDSSSALSSATPAAPSAGATANATATAAPPPSPPAGSATEAAAPPTRSTRLATPTLSSSNRSDTAAKVGGLLALALLIAALTAYIRGYGLMGGRIAD